MSDPADRWSVSLEETLLLDRYAVERAIGGGGMATVYLAHDRQLEMPVVVKVPHPAYLAEPGFRERFDRETRDLVALQHPHIVRILARGEHDGLPFLVLQFLRGGSLGDRLRRAAGTPIPWAEVRPWLRDVARALDFIHAQGVVHRDVKPDNVLFDEHGHAYLSDFGIAKAVGGADTGLTLTGMTPGSPAYMAPEQPRQSRLTGASDQYSLAASLYEALTGRPPHEGETAVDVLLRKQSEPPPAPRQLAPGIPVPVAHALQRALAADPAGRFPSCEALVEAMEGAGAAAPAPSPAAAPEPAPAPPEAGPATGGGGTTVTLAGSSRRTLWMVLSLLVLGVPLALVVLQQEGGGADRRAPGAEGGDTPAPPDAATTPAPLDDVRRRERLERLLGAWTVDRPALQHLLEGFRDAPKRPPRFRPERAEIERAIKAGFDLDIAADGTFTMTFEARDRPAPPALRGSWALAEDRVQFRPDPATVPEGLPHAAEPFQGRLRPEGLVLMRRGFELPLRKP